MRDEDDGETPFSLSYSPDPKAYTAPEDVTRGPFGGFPVAFGVNLLESLPNRPKPSDVDCGSPAWDAGVSNGRGENSRRPDGPHPRRHRSRDLRGPAVRGT